MIFICNFAHIFLQSSRLIRFQFRLKVKIWNWRGETSLNIDIYLKENLWFRLCWNVEYSPHFYENWLTLDAPPLQIAFSVWSEPLGFRRCHCLSSGHPENAWTLPQIPSVDVLAAGTAVAAQRDVAGLQWGTTLLSSHLISHHLHLYLHHQANNTSWEAEKCLWMNVLMIKYYIH